MNPLVIYRLARMARGVGMSRVDSLRWAFGLVARGRRATATRLAGTGRKSQIEMAARSRL